MPSQPALLVTGATGQLGRLVISALLSSVPAASIAALVRDKAKATDLSALGIDVRVCDYGDPATMRQAFGGIERLLLISSNDLSHRITHHRNAIEAAEQAGVALVAYTSVLHAPGSPLGLAKGHRQTEADFRASGLAFVFLRNGWYTENYTAMIPAALAHNGVAGSAGEGRIASAPRADFAAAAAAVLLDRTVTRGTVYELAGDEAYTLTEFAAELARQTDKPITYNNLPEAEFKALLVGAGLPPPVAALLADSDQCASRGALYDDGRQLSRLLGRPTVSMKVTMAAALRNDKNDPRNKQ